MHSECSNMAKQRWEKKEQQQFSKQSMLFVFQKNEKFLYSAGEKGHFHKYSLHIAYI